METGTPLKAAGARVDAHPQLKARLGPWYYAQAAIAVFLERYVADPPRVVAEIDGTRVEGVSVFVQNAQPYTYFRRRPVALSEGTGLTTGDLSAAVLTRANPLDVPTLAARLLSRVRVDRHRRVRAFDGLAGLRVRSTDARAVPLQVDGDFVGEDGEAVFSVLPAGLRVVA